MFTSPAKDDLSLLRDDGEIQPSVNDFVVASENLKRKNFLTTETVLTHADSEARQIVAEELADVLGLDSDVHMVSIISQSSAGRFSNYTHTFWMYFF